MSTQAQMAGWDLTRAMLEEEHSAAEYLAWVRALIKRVKLEPDGLARIRYRHGLAKELMNEALPIGRLASSYFGASEDVSIQLKVGNQNHDAVVSDRRPEGSGVQYIEVTLASEGEDDYLRMRVLHETGEVSGLGPVTKRGTSRTGLEVTVEPEAVSQTEVLRRERECVTKAITRKLDKSYPINTLLLIAFDDTIACGRSDNLANLESIVLAHLSQLNGFHSVAIVGMERNLLMSWQVRSAI